MKKSRQLNSGLNLSLYKTFQFSLDLPTFINNSFKNLVE